MDYDYSQFNIPSSTPGNRIRWDASGMGVGVPELVLVGKQRSPFATPLPLHHHGFAYEFHFIEHGMTSWVVGSQRIDTHPGQVLTTLPYEWHQGMDLVISPSHFWWMIIKAPPMHRTGWWLGLALEDQLLIAEHLRRVARVSAAPSSTALAFTQIRDGIEQQGPLSGLRVRIAIIEWILQLATVPDAKTNPPVVAPDAWQAVEEALLADLTHHPSTSALAGSLNVSEAYFYREFGHRFGLSPIAYWNRVRIRTAANRLVTKDTTITEIAMEFGYESSQHFASSFKKVMGCTPTAWRCAHGR